MDIHNDSTGVVVVGGGVAGLTAACYIARAGVEVTLLEQSSRMGGYAATRDHAGYLFNHGLHALYTGGAASEVLRDLGVAYSAGSPGPMRMVCDGVMQPYPSDPMTLLRHHSLSVGDKVELVRLFTRLPRMDSQSFGTLSVADWITQNIQRQQPRRLMTALAKTFMYTSALDLVSADACVRKIQQTLHDPIHYIDGGWQTLVDGLRTQAEQHGATIMSGAHVAQVLCEGNQAVGVQLRNGRAIYADAVVLAIKPQDVISCLPDAAPGLRKAVADLVPAVVACLDVALERLPNNINTVVQDIDQPCFLSAQSVYARVTPDGGAYVGTFKQLDSRVPSDPQADRRELERLLDIAQPGWRDVLVKAMFLPHIAAVGGLPLAANGGLRGRPTINAAGMERLFLAGDWVGAEGFLADPSFGSAREAAHAILHARIGYRSLQEA